MWGSNCAHFFREIAPVDKRGSSKPLTFLSALRLAPQGYVMTIAKMGIRRAHKTKNNNGRVTQKKKYTTPTIYRRKGFSSA